LPVFFYGHSPSIASALFHRPYTDEELIEGCVANDRQWQERLYRRYFQPMMSMCMRYAADREEAMTIVNDGFLRVFKKIHLYAFKGSFEGWIRRLVWHSLADHYRKKSKYLHFLVFEERDAPMEATPLQNLYAGDILTLVDQLPPASQEVFRLYAIEGFSHIEIARQLGISDGTSKWHLSNARQKLKQMMAASGHTASGRLPAGRG
jgi:RNA polymerase sigma factor (sigma-70 family)